MAYNNRVGILYKRMKNWDNVIIVVHRFSLTIIIMKMRYTFLIMYNVRHEREREREYDYTATYVLS